MGFVGGGWKIGCYCGLRRGDVISPGRHARESPPAWMQVVAQRREQAAEVIKPRLEQAAEESRKAGRESGELQ